MGQDLDGTAARQPTTADLRDLAAGLPVEPVPADCELARRAVGHYFAELDRRFEAGFAAAEQSAHDAEAMSPPDGIFLVVVDDVEPVACGGLQTIGPGIAEIKRMWVHPEWRGAGLGRRLLAALELRAVELGRDRIRLDTNDTLTEAIAMYQRAGYRKVDRYNDNPYARLWFEKELRQESISDPVDP
ncbi:GNAT family N-acetyltransferase [Microlunatus elymi]|uniref:GNAT family N-acetyltransferase n=1 Tax=Microlunatus elymi TaxID=2596828 RepID=A0A516PU17_9ACTN|nr:GNAT family N-acetyltransferase [Microlunatus elymi]QDP94695.1 GNAT family N-acetyltransferase [Microlunatus elymi]